MLALLHYFVIYLTHLLLLPLQYNRSTAEWIGFVVWLLEIRISYLPIILYRAMHSTNTLCTWPHAVSRTLRKERRSTTCFCYSCEYGNQLKISFWLHLNSRWFSCYVKNTLSLLFQSCWSETIYGANLFFLRANTLISKLF